MSAGAFVDWEVQESDRALERQRHCDAGVGVGCGDRGGGGGHRPNCKGKFRQCFSRAQ